MSTMALSPELIEYAKKEVHIVSFFEKSDEVTANHILYQQFIESSKWKGLPKIIFYILMSDVYGQPHLKDKKGLLGYALKIIK
jgi:hypothetical protein